MTLSTAELHARLGVSNNTLNRLTNRGVLMPSRVDSLGARGYVFRWSTSEARAAAAVVALTRSHLLDNFKRRHDVDALRAVAAEARRREPSSTNRWLILSASGRCVAGSDWLAVHTYGHRTLIPLVQP